MDNILNIVKDLSFTNIVNWVASGVMIFGGVVPFIPQYREIRRKGDAEGFSLYVCLVLLVSNILRILFWCGKKYEIPLLIQSMVMNITMLFMIHVCISVKNKSQLIRGPERLFTEINLLVSPMYTDPQLHGISYTLGAFKGILLLKIGCILDTGNIKTTYRLFYKLKNLLSLVKDKFPLRAPGVYGIPVAVGQYKWKKLKALLPEALVLSDDTGRVSLRVKF